MNYPIARDSRSQVNWRASQPTGKFWIATLWSRTLGAGFFFFAGYSAAIQKIEPVVIAVTSD
jgi:hypothetical protein